MMGNAYFLKEGVEFFIFSAPISLHCNYFPIEFAFNKILKVLKNLKHFKFLFEKIDPYKFAIVINEAYIV